MIIGIPREIKASEHRVGLLPSEAYQLIQRGHRVVVEKNAGASEAKPELKSGINVMAGQVTCLAVAESHGMEWVELDQIPEAS